MPFWGQNGPKMDPKYHFAVITAQKGAETIKNHMNRFLRHKIGIQLGPKNHVCERTKLLPFTC